MNQTEQTRATATAYFDAWRARDFDRLRTVLSPDVQFIGVLGSASGVEECIEGLRAMAETMLEDIVLQVRVVEGSEVLTWFDLIPSVDAPPIPAVNWSHVEDGLITQIKVTFDPRSLFEY